MCEITRAICMTRALILHACSSLHTTWMAQHVKQDLSACKRLQFPYVKEKKKGHPLKWLDVQDPHSEWWVFFPPQLRKLSLCYCLLRIRWCIITGASVIHGWGENYLQQRLSSAIYCRWRWRMQQRGHGRPATVSRLKGGVGGGDTWALT